MVISFRVGRSLVYQWRGFNVIRTVLTAMAYERGSVDDILICTFISINSNNERGSANEIEAPDSRGKRKLGDAFVRNWTVGACSPDGYEGNDMIIESGYPNETESSVTEAISESQPLK